MTSIVFHLILTAAVIWYQRRQGFRTSPWLLTAFWYLVSMIMVLFEASAVTGHWFSGLLIQGFVVGAFYLPAVFMTLHLARRWRDGVWWPFLAFLAFAMASTVLAAVFLANAPWVQGIAY